MPFSTESMVAFREREIEERKAMALPDGGKFNFQIVKGEVFDSNGLPKLSINLKVIASKDGSYVGRFHSDYQGWYASETSNSDTPLDQREATIRHMTATRLHNYMKALADAPYSTQEIGELLDQEIKNLQSLTNEEDVIDCFESIGALLQGQEITATIKHAAKGPWVNIYPNTYDATIGAELSVTV